jgi:H+/Cl- antiporter ClcA
VAAGILIGAANALGLLGFEWVTEHLTGPDLEPLGRQPRDPLAGRAPGDRRQRRALGHRAGHPSDADDAAPHRRARRVKEAKSGTLRTIAVLLVTGVVSLVGGGSLGPEGAVIPVSIAFGAWVAGYGRTSGPVTQLLVLSSIGALLVSFFGSLIPAPIPLLLMRRQGTPLTRRTAIPPLLAGVTAWAIVSLIHGHTQGPDILPIDSGGGLDAVVPALVLGMLAVLVGVLLRLMIRAMHS